MDHNEGTQTMLNRPETTAELWVRELAPTGIADRQCAIYERLQHLSDRGAIAAVEIDTWGKYARPPTDRIPESIETPATETLREIVEWERASDLCLDPAFERRTTSTIPDGTERDVVVLPLVTLAIYEGDRLRCVYPHSHDGEESVCTVEDGIATLETDDPESDSVTLRA